MHELHPISPHGKVKVAITFDDILLFRGALMPEDTAVERPQSSALSARSDPRDVKGMTRATNGRGIMVMTGGT